MLSPSPTPTPVLIQGPKKFSLQALASALAPCSKGLGRRLGFELGTSLGLDLMFGEHRRGDRALGGAYARLLFLYGYLLAYFIGIPMDVSRINRA